MREPLSVMSACPECGVLVPDETSMCGRCGASLESTGSLFVTERAIPQEDSGLFPARLLESSGDAPLDPGVVGPQGPVAPAPTPSEPETPPIAEEPRDPLAAQGLRAALAAEADGRRKDAIRILERAHLQTTEQGELNHQGSTSPLWWTKIPLDSRVSSSIRSRSPAADSAALR